jgi:invasion protein IalB
MSLSHLSSYLRCSRWALVSGLAIATAGGAMADPASAPAPANQVVRRDQIVYDFWTVGCSYFAGPAKTKTCTASLPVHRNGSKQLIVVLVVGPDTKGKLRFQAIVPTTTVIGPGILVKFDRGEINLPIFSCDPNACVGNVAYSEAIATRLAATKKVEVRWTNISSGPVTAVFSVKGAREALAALGR